MSIPIAISGRGKVFSSPVVSLSDATVYAGSPILHITDQEVKSFLPICKQYHEKFIYVKQ
jgi:hypothetical protein